MKFNIAKSWKSFLVGLLFTLTCSWPIQAATLHGEVVGISDGDTVTILDISKRQHKVRLAGIDAPEKRQAYGERSRQSLADLLFNKRVVVEYSKTDRYGRIVGKVLVSGVDASLRQVALGMAWHYKQYESEQSVSDRKAYSEAENLARTERRGLWRDHSAMPPWEFRRARRLN